MESATTSTRPRTVVAVDIAKQQHEVLIVEGTVPHRRAKLPTGCFRQVENAAPALDRFVRTLRQMDPPARVYCEASGGYEIALLKACAKHRVEVCRLPADRVRSHAKALGLHAKNDPLDCRVIGSYAMTHDPTPTAPCSPAQEQLRHLVDRRIDLIEDITREQGRIDTASPVSLTGIRRHIRFLEKEVETIDEKIQKLLDADPVLGPLAVELTKVCGVGKVTASVLLGHLPELGRVSRAEIKALAGLCPYDHDSGDSRGKRHRNGGRAVVRRALYMAVLSGSVHNEVLRTYVERMNALGKPKMVGLTNAMAKLLIHLNAIARKHYETADQASPPGQS